MLAAIRRASSREALEIKYGHWSSQEESDFWGAVYEAFRIHTRDFRGNHLHRKTR
jgi:hypothetical protein